MQTDDALDANALQDADRNRRRKRPVGRRASPAEGPSEDPGTGEMRTDLSTLARKYIHEPVKSQLKASLLALNRMAGLEISQPAPAAEHEPESDAGWVDTSQAGEASLLRGLLREGLPQYLVDVGAYDGETLSNSRPFVLDGWEAILVEPHPVQFKKLADLYDGVPNARLVNKACAESPGRLPLFLGAGGPDTTTSTLCTDDNAWYSVTRTAESIDVEVTTLTALLDEHGFPPDFALLLVDAEGADYEVLRGLDFSRFRPRVVVTEEYILDPEKHSAKFRLLLDAGYTYVTQQGANTVWIRTEWVLRCLDLA